MKPARRAIALALLAGASAAQAQTASYAIDPTHTFASFEIRPAGISTLTARFDRKQGSLEFDRAGRSGKVDITVEIASVNTGVPALDKRLQDKDIFDAAAFPTARFVSARFAFDGDKLAEVAGTLTLHGKSDDVTLKASNFNCYTSPLFRREVCGGDFEATLQRSRWGLAPGLPATVADSVRLLVQIEAIRQ